MKRRALLSVSDKTGLIELAQCLIQHDIELISTGGTKLSLQKAGLPVLGIEEVTGFEEMLDGRVKTLHPMRFMVDSYFKEIILNMLNKLRKQKFNPLIS